MKFQVSLTTKYVGKNTWLGDFSEVQGREPLEQANKIRI